MAQSLSVEHLRPQFGGGPDVGFFVGDGAGDGDLHLFLYGPLPLWQSPLLQSESLEHE